MRLATSFLVLLLAGAWGCSDSDDAGDTGAGTDTSIGIDSTTGDTGTSDTGTPDTGGGDGAPADTSVSDTGAADTGAADTGASDSGGIDTGPADTGAATCTPPCGIARDCCSGECTNLQNDPRNCGGCGTTCGAGTYCTGGSCVAIPCTASCSSAETCCGTMCCGAGTICCDPQGPISAGPQCVIPDSRGTCPVGCAPLCVEM